MAAVRSLFAPKDLTQGTPWILSKRKMAQVRNSIINGSQHQGAVITYFLIITDHPLGQKYIRLAYAICIR